MIRFDAAIFDLDGTLLDSMYIWDCIGSDFLRARGIEPEQGLDDKFKNMTMQQAVMYYRSVYLLSETEAELLDQIRLFIRHYYTDIVPAKDGVLQLLDVLHNKGVRMCVATASDNELATVALSRNGLLQYMDGIITCGEVGKGKDDPAIFNAAADIVQTPPSRCIVFEDSLNAVTTAHNSGFMTCGVYDASSHSDSEAIRDIADIYCDDYYKLAEMINL